MKFKIDTKAIKAEAKEFAGYGDAVKRAEFRAVNKVGEKAFTRSKRAITEIVNVTPTYAADHMKMSKAIMDRPVAVITATSVRGTILTRYGAKQLTASAPKAKGNPSLGIPAGRKAAGVAVTVSRKNGRKVMNDAFLRKLKNGNGLGVFRRVGGKVQHQLGPSMDQTFTLVINDIEGDVANELEATFAKQLDFELRGLK